MSETSDGVQEATGAILDALQDAGIETSEELMAIIHTDIQQAVAPVEAERDNWKEMHTQEHKNYLLLERARAEIKAERDEAHAELERVRQENKELEAAILSDAPQSLRNRSTKGKG